MRVSEGLGVKVSERLAGEDKGRGGCERQGLVGRCEGVGSKNSMSALANMHYSRKLSLLTTEGTLMHVRRYTSPPGPHRRSQLVHCPQVALRCYMAHLGAWKMPCLVHYNRRASWNGES